MTRGTVAIPPEREADFRAAHEAGATHVQLATQFRISTRTVAATLRRLGITPRPVGGRSVDRDEVLRLHAEGLSPARIAERGIASPNYVAQIIREASRPVCLHPGCAAPISRRKSIAVCPDHIHGPACNCRECTNNRRARMAVAAPRIAPGTRQVEVRYSSTGADVARARVTLLDTSTIEVTDRPSWMGAR